MSFLNRHRLDISLNALNENFPELLFPIFRTFARPYVRVKEILMSSLDALVIIERR